MIQIKKQITKNGQVRYYKAYGFSSMLSRNLPMKKAEAEELLAKGEAELVDYLPTFTDFGRYCDDMRKEQEELRENVIDISEAREARRKKQEEKKEQEKKDREIQAAIEKFEREVVSMLSQDELLRLAEAAASGDSEHYKAELQRVFMISALRKVSI